MFLWCQKHYLRFYYSFLPKKIYLCIGNTATEEGAKVRKLSVLVGGTMQRRREEAPQSRLMGSACEFTAKAQPPQVKEACPCTIKTNNTRAELGAFPQPLHSPSVTPHQGSRGGHLSGRRERINRVGCPLRSTGTRKWQSPWQRPASHPA